jgi:predicted nucleic acid-binding protein
VKLYIREEGTDRLLQLAGNLADNRFAVLALSQVEFRSAVRRRQRAGDIDSRIANLVLDRFNQHLEARFLRQALTDSLLDVASEMIDRYALRAFDAVQLAGCLALKTAMGVEPPAFVCSDQQLLEAARSELLSVLDPCASN